MRLPGCARTSLCKGIMAFRYYCSPRQETLWCPTLVRVGSLSTSLRSLLGFAFLAASYLAQTLTLRWLAFLTPLPWLGVSLVGTLR